MTLCDLLAHMVVWAGMGRKKALRCGAGSHGQALKVV